MVVVVIVVGPLGETGRDCVGNSGDCSWKWNFGQIHEVTSMSDQRLWILSLGNGQPLRIFEQGSKMATLSRTDLDWGHGKRTKINESVRISWQPKLQWTREVKMEINKTLSFPSLVN